jgi:formylglycine-generating enzyme required for sulfatase activity
MKDGEKICGCTPVASRAAISPPAEVPQTSQALTAGVSVNLPGGTFLMGTDYAGGFPMDGEGPVRRVSLSPFAIDVFPVNNAEFATLVVQGAGRDLGPSGGPGFECAGSSAAPGSSRFME